jgi:hypothetical protein
VAESDAASACEDAGIIGALPSLTAQLRPAFAPTVSSVIDPSPLPHHPNRRFSPATAVGAVAVTAYNCCAAHAHTSALTRNPHQTYRSDLQRVGLTAPRQPGIESLICSPALSIRKSPISSPQSLVLSHPFALHEGVSALPAGTARAEVVGTRT